MLLAYLGVGSNLGDRLQNITTAVVKLDSIGKFKARSSIWETSPWGGVEQNYFLNCVVIFETVLQPSELLEQITKIELSMGRKRELQFGPRIIDIDILFYDALTINLPNLTIPHPLLHKRKFVLLPLAEIAPTFVHPTLKKEIKQLIKELSSDEDCHIYRQANKI